MGDTELLVNLRNHQRAEREITRVVSDYLKEPADADVTRRQEALGRLQARAERDETVADLLTVLGLV